MLADEYVVMKSDDAVLKDIKNNNDMAGLYVLVTYYNTIYK